MEAAGESSGFYRTTKQGCIMGKDEFHMLQAASILMRSSVILKM